MFAYLIGKITQKQDNHIVLECNNIGYDIIVSNFCLKNLDVVTGEIKIYTYYQQKEDAVCLFGFDGLEEKNMFLNLISVSGVGPKGAISILSNITPTDLGIIISKQDAKALSNVKGVGKKTSERILVELKDKIGFFEGEIAPKVSTNREIDDALEVLCSLGLNKNEAMKIAQDCYKKGDNAETIISKSLTQIRK